MPCKSAAAASKMAQAPPTSEPGPRMVKSMFTTGGVQALSISEEGLAKARRDMQAVARMAPGESGNRLTLITLIATSFYLWFGTDPTSLPNS